MNTTRLSKTVLKSSWIFILFFSTFCTLPLKSQAGLISSEISLMGGFYQNFNGDNRFPVYFYWNFSEILKSGIEVTFDVGANNNLVDNTWSLYAYQFYLTVPVSSGFEEAPYRRSRIQLGRQWLTEGFEFSLLDGAYAPLYWSPHGGVSLFGGANYVLQTKVIDFNSQIYGGSVHQEFLKLKWKAGALYKKPSSDAGVNPQTFAFASVNQSFENVWLKPAFILKGQMNLSESSFDQALAEIELSPLNRWTLGGNYTRRQRHASDPLNTYSIYRLFALSVIQSAGGHLSWTPHDDIHIHGSFKQASYTSSGGEDTGQELDFSADWVHSRFILTPAFTYISSYGGSFLGPSLGFRIEFFNGKLGARANAGAAKIKKINGMESWAYDGRLGVDYKLSSKMMAMVFFEAERNHVYEFDARTILYFSYFLF